MLYPHSRLNIYSEAIATTGYNNAWLIVTYSDDGSIAQLLSDHSIATIVANICY